MPSVVEGMFLGALNAAERVGMGGSALRLYNDIVQRGRRAPVTEKDFSRREIEDFRKLVEAYAARTGKTQGHISYPDYMKHRPAPDSNILGGFNFTKKKDGSIEITDQYDFNLSRRGGREEDNPIMQAIAAFANPRGLAAKIGRDILPDSKPGVPVHIRIVPPSAQRTILASSLRE